MTAWPEGDTLAVECPHCNASVTVQIAVVRELGSDVRPADCESCSAEFELWSDGTTKLTFSPPKESTARGRELLNTPLVFDPSL